MEKETQTEKFVTTSMLEFINEHIKTSCIKTLDEIILNYVATVLQDLAGEPGSLENIFDVEEFSEMMDAYFPGFFTIPHSIVSQWVFKLVSSLRESAKKGTAGKNGFNEPAFESFLDQLELDQSSQERNDRSKRVSESSSDSCSSFGGNGSGRKSIGTPHLSSESDSDVIDIIQRLKIDQYQFEEKTNMLMEMFPDLLKSEAQNYIVNVKGDLEQAVQMVLNGQVSPSYIPRSHENGKLEKEDPKVLKDRIVARYGFIDKAEDNKEFRPPPIKEEPKKLVRYREGQVVSTKGERYSEINKKNYLYKPNKNN